MAKQILKLNAISPLADAIFAGYGYGDSCENPDGIMVRSAQMADYNVGDKLVAAGVPLISGYGASEFGSPTKPWDEVPEGQLLYNPDWAWLRISDNVKAEFVPQGDGTFELVLHVSVCAVCM